MRNLIERIRESDTACELLAFLPVSTFIVVVVILVLTNCR